MKAAIILFAAASAFAAAGPILPEKLGPYTRGDVAPVQVAQTDRDLFQEYGLKASEQAQYTNAGGGRMGVEALQFADSEGGHATFLCLRPAPGVRSPLTVARFIGVNGAVGSGTTVIGWKNYVLRFRGDAPSLIDFEAMLGGLPAIDPNEPSPDYYRQYADESSERWLMGPVSLARFAPRIPPSNAAFHLGAKGRLVRFETPAGTVTRVVFTYPSTEAAQQRTAEFRALQGVEVQAKGSKVAIILDPLDLPLTRELLEEGTAPFVTWDPNYLWDAESLTLESGLAFAFAGCVLGAIIATLLRISKPRDAFPDRSISLDI